MYLPFTTPDQIVGQMRGHLPDGADHPWLLCLADRHAGAGAGHHDPRPAPSVFTEAGQVPQGALLILAPRRTTVQVRHGWRRMHGPMRIDGEIAANGRRNLEFYSKTFVVAPAHTVA
jgi:hypothetical protein